MELTALLRLAERSRFQCKLRPRSMGWPPAQRRRVRKRLPFSYSPAASALASLPPSNGAACVLSIPETKLADRNDKTCYR